MLRTAAVFALAAAAGGALRASGVPAAWLVGPTLAAAAVALTLGWRVDVPAAAYRAAQAVMGMTISASFQPGSVRTVAEHWPTVVSTAAAVLLLSLAGGIWLARTRRLDPATALLGTLSGGASGMVAMSDDLGGDARIVAFMQYARLSVMMAAAAAVASLAGSPAAAGAARAGGAAHPAPLAYALTAIGAAAGVMLGHLLRLPAGTLVGPVLVGLALGALGLPHGAWPPGTLQAAYCAMGVAIGSRYDRPSLGRIGRIVPAVLGFMALLMAGSALVAWALVAWTGLDWLTAYLATAPGGIEAATAAALDAGADTPLVLTAHVVRVLAVVLLGPPAVRLILARSRAGEPSAGQPPRTAVT